MDAARNSRPGQPRETEKQPDNAKPALDPPGKQHDLKGVMQDHKENEDARNDGDRS
jgi:hypothetical protein